MYSAEILVNGILLLANLIRVDTNHPSWAKSERTRIFL